MSVVFSFFAFIFFITTAVAERGENNLHHAADKGDLTVVKRLVGSGTPVDIRDQYEYTPLYYAARMGHEDVAVYLLDRGADVNAQGKNGRTPLHGSFFYRGHFVEMVNLLLNRGAKVDLPDGSGRTSLNLAILRGQIEVVSELIFRGGRPVSPYRCR